MAHAVYGIVKNHAAAADIVDRLKLAGFLREGISIVAGGQSGDKEFVVEHHTKAPEAAAAGAGTGAVLGGALGWLTGIGALAIPGLGPLIAAGPIMAALSGAALGGTLGGLAGGLAGLGIPEFEAKRYENKVSGGNVLISVHTENSDETDRARSIFETGGAEDITTSSEASVAGRH